MGDLGQRGVVLVGAYLAVISATVTLAVRYVRWRRAELSTAGLPEVLEGIASRLRSGVSFVRALPEGRRAGASPAESQLGRLRSWLELGLPRAEAIQEWSEELVGESWSLVTAVLSIGTGLGGGDARALDHTAAVLRDRSLRKLTVRSQAAQARSSALLVGISPWVITLVSRAGGGRSATLLMTTRWGQWCLVTAAGLDLAGAHWMFQLVGVTERRVGGV